MSFTVNDFTVLRKCRFLLAFTTFPIPTAVLKYIKRLHFHMPGVQLSTGGLMTCLTTLQAALTMVHAGSFFFVTFHLHWCLSNDWPGVHFSSQLHCNAWNRCFSEGRPRLCCHLMEMMLLLLHNDSEKLWRPFNILCGVTTTRCHHKSTACSLPSTSFLFFLFAV